MLYAFKGWLQVMRFGSNMECDIESSFMPFFFSFSFCYIEQVGAGTMNPLTYLRVLGPEPWNVA